MTNTFAGIWIAYNDIYSDYSEIANIPTNYINAVILNLYAPLYDGAVATETSRLAGCIETIKESGLTCVVHISMEPDMFNFYDKCVTRGDTPVHMSADAVNKKSTGDLYPKSQTYYEAAQTIAIDVSAKTLTRPEADGTWASIIGADTALYLVGCTTLGNDGWYSGLSGHAGQVLTYTTKSTSATAGATEAGNGVQFVTDGMVCSRGFFETGWRTYYEGLVTLLKTFDGTILGRPNLKIDYYLHGELGNTMYPTSNFDVTSLGDFVTDTSWEGLPDPIVIPSPPANGTLYDYVVAANGFKEAWADWKYTQLDEWLAAQWGDYPIGRGAIFVGTYPNYTYIGPLYSGAAITNCSFALGSNDPYESIDPIYYDRKTYEIEQTMAPDCLNIASVQFAIGNYGKAIVFPDDIPNRIALCKSLLNAYWLYGSSYWTSYDDILNFQNYFWLAGSTTAANDGLYLVSNVTDTVLTYTSANGHVPVTEAGNGSQSLLGNNLNITGLTVAIDATAKTLTRSSGSWITDGVALNMTDDGICYVKYFPLLGGGYSMGAYADLPADEANLETYYTDADIIKVAADDADMVAQSATGEYAIHQFKVDATGKSSVTITWIGQVNKSPSVSTVYLQIYDRSETPAWDTIDSDNSSEINIDIELTASIADLANYKDANGIIACRVYQ